MVFIEKGGDLDALSSAYGITIIHPEAKIVLPQNLSQTAIATLKKFPEKFKKRVIKKENLKNVKKIFIVDSHNINRALSELKKFLSDEVFIEVFDHHQIVEPLEDRFTIDGIKVNLSYHLKNTGAATSIVVNQIKEKGLKIDGTDATILALGIYEDTGSFTYKMTTPFDMEMASFLLENNLDLNTLRDILEKRISDKQLRVLEQLSDNIQYIFTENKKVAISTAYCLEYIPDLSSVLSMIEAFENVDAFFVILNTRGKITVIGRSKTEDINVGKILLNLGGGGHPFAASATVKGLSTQEVKSILESLILTNLYKDAKVKDIMDSNVSIFPEDTQINDIPEEYLEKPALFVVDKKGKFQGIVLTKVIKDALRHGVKEAEISNFLLNDIYVFSPETTLGEAEQYILTSSQEIFPVVEKGKVSGMVTRNQIVLVLHGQPFNSEKDVFISRERIKPKYIRFSHKLKNFFPDYIVNHFIEIGKLAKELGFNVYIVGGVVRDIILGKRNLDIDLIVEGDAPVLAKEYAKRKKLKVHTFEEFMTAQLTIENDLKIDFATARKETYEYPGAYPKVEKATLKEDLYRRDFTINTLAIDITEGNFGVLIDYFNGLRDIKDKVIRILHQLSFVEDPIRILRALRFAGRLGFRLGKPTEKLLKLAVEEELLKVAPTGRVNLEFTYSFNEEKALEIIYLMNKYRVLHQLIPEYFFNQKREEVLNRLRDMIITFEMFFQIKVDRVSNYLLALMYHLPMDVSYLFLQKYHFHHSVKFFEEFFKKRTIFKHIPEKNSQFYKNIKDIKKDILVFFASYLDVEVSERIVHILKKEEERKLLLSGKDLKELGLKPSPLYKEILEDVFEKYLDGEIKNKEEAINYVKGKYLKLA